MLSESADSLPLDEEALVQAEAAAMQQLQKTASAKSLAPHSPKPPPSLSRAQ